MSKVSHATARATRVVNDEWVNVAGDKAIIYRFTGDFEDSGTIQDEVDKLYEEFDSTTTDTIYQPPEETRVNIKWPDDLFQTDDGKIIVDGEDPIQAKFKFTDYVTPRSYVKVPFSSTNFENQGEDVLTDASEKEQIIRLEVVKLKTSGDNIENKMVANMSIKRDDGDRHPDDNAPLDQVHANFFDEF